jgi:hypothetical protein
MPIVSYICNGFTKSPTDTDRRRGFSELRFWNPTAFETAVRMRAYFADREPAGLDPIVIKPYDNPLLVFPFHNEAVFSEAGPWGMRLVSDTPIMADHILVAGDAANGDPLKGADVKPVQLLGGFFGPPERTQYAGGVGDCLIRSRLARVWYFSDGIIIKTDPANPPFPFSEFEWYHLLNPGPRPARVQMHRYLSGGRHDVLEYEVGAERVLLISNYDPEAAGVAYGIRFESTELLCIESERFIYDPRGLDVWGSHIHCQRPGLPAPLEWNEETT